jgi:prepilin peptidase CpaA
MPPALALFATGLAFAAAHDVKSRRVPNALILTFLGMGFLARAILDGPSGMAGGLLGMLVGLAIPFLPFAFGLLGAADVKLLASMGVWLGPKVTATAAYYGLMAAGAIGIALVLYHRDQRRALWDRLVEIWLTHRLIGDPLEATCNRKTVPMAVGLAVGGILAAIESGALTNG